MIRKSVSSSQIKSIGYDDASKTLELEFSSGSVYQYRDVPAAVAADLEVADSIGRYFGANIKDRYETLKLDEQGNPQPLATAKASPAQLGYIRGLTIDGGLWYGNANERVGPAWRDVLSAAGWTGEQLFPAAHDWPLVDTFIDGLSSKQATAVISQLKARRG